MGFKSFESIVPESGSRESVLKMHASLPEGMGQSINSRLWDMFQVFCLAAKKSQTDTVWLEVIFLVESSGGIPVSQLVGLKEVCSPGDDTEPVLTITKA